MADEEALRPIRELLEKVRERVDYAIARLKSFEELRCLRWRCVQCGYTKRFTKPMPAEVAPPCPRCRSTEFEAAV
jgi:rubrerythrin